MTFLESISEVGAADTEGIGATRSQLGSLVSQGLSEGLSGRTMLSVLQENGLGVRRGDFYDLLGEVRAAQSMGETWSSLPLDLVPDESVATVWTGGATNTYLYRVRMYIREGGSEGMGFYQGNFDVVTDELITPAEALERAADQFNSGVSSDNYPNQELWGQSLGGIYHQLGQG
jgi:hypothetical protein